MLQSTRVSKHTKHCFTIIQRDRVGKTQGVASVFVETRRRDINTPHFPAHFRTTSPSAGKKDTLVESSPFLALFYGARSAQNPFGVNKR